MRFHWPKKEHIGLALVVGTLLLFLIVKWKQGSLGNSKYLPIKPIAQHKSGQYFAGSETCKECHPKIYKDHLQTAHFNSSAKADSYTVKGSFKNPENSFRLNDSVQFQMNTRNGSLFQDILLETKDTLLGSASMDVVIGSGTKGQTYLHWEKNALYQLQVSYFASNKKWVNSPGYPAGELQPDRPVLQRCLECHMTHAQSTGNFGKRNGYLRKQMVYGIDCERCHGPSLQHVNYHRQNREEILGKHVLAYKDLSRQQRLDGCAICHSGIRSKSNANAFGFIIGDTLKRFSMPDYDEGSIADLDVHGNQYGLLSQSKCFEKSKTMDCTTCHNPHSNERNLPDHFNKICISCHNQQLIASQKLCSRPLETLTGDSQNCIGCHMPKSPSKSMKIEISGDYVQPVYVRTHYIGIYAQMGNSGN